MKVTSEVRDLAVKLLAPGFPKLMSGVVDTAREAGADLNPYSSYDEVNQELLVTALFAVVRLASETGTDPSPGYKARSSASMPPEIGSPPGPSAGLSDESKGGVDKGAGNYSLLRSNNESRELHRV
ncbi:hypothetical protein M231_00720 [Tremella mesenterica]|uniref:Uncharacterized protein n=1 Tax=Tremella mesenterica TaxID=5217 RepID=A0A4Q1BV32_TREME|nr:hypothetical protein M231_00720 [Tremella mesenterica]